MLTMDYIIVSLIFLQRNPFFFFWCFNFYFFDNYYYFFSFYEASFQYLFFKKQFFILMIAFFFLAKNMLNFFLKIMMRKMHLSHVNTILGGLCGILKGIFFVMLLLWVLQYFNKVGYDNYVKHSILIAVFLKIFNEYE
jgi:hypothetical protein